MFLPPVAHLRLLARVMIIFIVAAGLSGFSLTQPTPVEAARPLPDLEGHSAQREIRVLYNKGIILGFPDGLFHPEGEVTRAQLAKMLVEAQGYGPEAQLIGGSRTRFSDVPRDHWAAAYVEVAADVGYITGYPDRSFRPDQPVTRAELVVMLVRALGWEREVTMVDPNSLTFQDRQAIPIWAAGYISLAYRRHLADVFDDGTFRAQMPATRDDAALMIRQMLSLNNTLYDVAGFVQNVAGSTLSVTVQGEVLNVNLLPQTDIFIGESFATGADIRVLDEVGVVFDDQGRATQVDIYRKDVNGRVRSVDADNRTMTLLIGDSLRSFPLAQNAKVFRNGVATKIENIGLGDDVFAVASQILGNLFYVDAVHFNATGRIVATGAGEMTVDVISTDGKNSTLTLTDDTVVIIDGQYSTPQNLATGDMFDAFVDNGVAMYVEARRGGQ